MTKPAFDPASLGAVGQAMVRLGVLAFGLTTDREWVAAQVDSGDEFGSARRAYVRVMLSFIEGMSHAIKDLLIAADREKRLSLSLPEVFVLREVQFEVDGKARARAVRRPLRTKDGVRFLLKLLGRVAQPPFEPQFGDDGWRAFSEAIEIRNRVTHPRSREDLWLTDKDLDVVDRAVLWFEDETEKFLITMKPRRKDEAQ